MFIILALFPLLLCAQNRGIKWTEDLSWTQLKEKARMEDKYIFIDAFTTWCSPCKQMDKYVYINDTVGNYFNDKFISVKVQMDRTIHDNQHIKSWYNDAIKIGEDYKIIAYPSFIFLSPIGQIVHKESGLKSVSDFISLGQIALTPGRSYNNPYEEYEKLVLAFQQGEKTYNKMPYMVKTALSLGDVEFAKSIIKEYNPYVLSLKDSQLYTKENIEYFSTVLNSKSRLFHLFFPDGKKIDAVMGRLYARNTVDLVITREIVNTYLSEKIGGGFNMIGMNVSQEEPNWTELSDSIRVKYGVDYAERNLLDARIEAYSRQKKYDLWAKNLIDRYRKYGVDKPYEDRSGRLNFVCWIMYENVNKREYLEVAASYMRGVVKGAIKENKPFAQGLFIDTYARLLYKLGNVQKAISWEQKAIEKMRISGAVDQVNEYLEVISHMRKNESLN